MRTKAIGGPLHGKSVFLQGVRQGQRQDRHAAYEHEGALYVQRMWEDAEGRMVPVLVLTDMELGEAFDQALQVMNGSDT